MVESAVAEVAREAAPRQPEKAGARRKKGRANGGGPTAGERNAELGRRGEDAAARFLERRGYEIVARNWTCVAGEADIVARDREWVVFVEVKTRSNCDYGQPSEAVNADKRERYERIAACFLADYDVVDVPLRFDVVSVVAVGPDRAMISHYLDAFCAD